MAKIKYDKDRLDSSRVRSLLKFYYENKFFKIWMSKFHLEGLDYQQEDYVMKKFWSEGTIAVSKAVGIPKSVLDDEENNRFLIVFTPWTMGGVYNIYDFPTTALPVNTRGVNFISNKELEVDKDIFILYCQKNKKSIYSSIEAKLNELIDVEMVKRIALKAQKQPFLFTSSPENRVAVEKLAKDLESDNPTLFTTLEDNEKGKGFTSGAPYIVDKLEMQRQKIEDDIMTILGSSNVGVAEKKEHLVVGEIEANNSVIEQYGSEFEEMMQKGFDRVNKAFGLSVNVVDMTPTLSYMDEDDSSKGENEDE